MGSINALRELSLFFKVFIVITLRILRASLLHFALFLYQIDD